MSGQVTRKSGEVLFLEAQLSDKELSLPLRIIAELLEGDGTLIKTVELSHVGDGVFIEDTEAMTAIPVLFVKYNVYAPDGITPNLDYVVSEDRFMLDSGVDGTGSAPSSCLLVGTIIRGKLMATLGSKSMIGVISKNSLQSLVYSNKLNGIISSKTLIGERL